MELEQLIKSGRWNFIRKFWNNSSLQEPRYSEEYDEIAWFNFQDHTTWINKKSLDEILGPESLEITVMHEVGHHALIPHNYGVALELINEANKVLKNPTSSKLVENLFDDIIVNTFIAKKNREGKEQLINAYKNLNKFKNKNQGEIEPLFQLYTRIYEKLWNLDRGTIYKTDIKYEDDAEYVCHFIEPGIFSYHSWKEKISKFAKVVEKYIQEEHHSGKYVIMIDNSELDKDKAVQEGAKLIPYNDLKSLAIALGLGNIEKVKRNIYLGLAEEHEFIFPSKKSIGGSIYPHTPETWTLDDPVSRLDFNGTLSKYGIIIPEMTTQKWKYQQGESFENVTNFADLLIVLDTSGSMVNPNKDLSYAHLSALIACNSTLNMGSKVSVINFSDDSFITQYCKDRETLYENIFSFQEGGTTIPSYEIEEMVNSNSEKQHILIITDAGICNLQESISNLSNSILGNSGTLFLVGGGNEESKETKILEDIGYKVRSIKSNQDLVSLTAQDIEETYR